MVDFPITVLGHRFTPIVDSAFLMPAYGPQLFSNGVFFARHEQTGCLSVIAEDHSDFHILPACINSISDAHTIFAFAARWYQWGKSHGASEQQKKVRLALGV